MNYAFHKLSQHYQAKYMRTFARFRRILRKRRQFQTVEWLVEKPTNLSRPNIYVTFPGSAMSKWLTALGFKARTEGWKIRVGLRWCFLTKKWHKCSLSDFSLFPSSMCPGIFFQERYMFVRIDPQLSSHHISQLIRNESIRVDWQDDLATNLRIGVINVPIHVFYTKETHRHLRKLVAES